MLSRVSRFVRRIYPPRYELEAEIPQPATNYNQAPSSSRDEYIHTFKERSCLREVPFFIRKGLKPGSGFLDYGCGLGRIAYPLSKYLNSSGDYYGYEPHPGARAFLKQAYSAHSNFHFSGEPLRIEDDYVGVALKQKVTSERDANQVDLSFVTRPIDIQYSSSVFTHMYEEPIVRTLQEIAKVMSPNGLCINTWLCVDDFAAYILRCGMADRTLPYKFGRMLAGVEESPLAMSAYEIDVMREIYDAADHDILEILPGSWAGRENGITYQDVVVSKPRLK